MEAIMDYLLQSSAVLALFYLIYLLVFRNERLFVEVRFYLLASALFALVLPLMKFSYTLIVEPSLVNADIGSLFIDPIASDTITATTSVISILEVLIWIYVLVCTVLLTRSILKLRQITQLIKAGEYREVDKQKLILLDQSTSAFTFFGYIVMNREEFNNKSLHNILAHEKVHAQQKHWIDLLFVELLTIVFWFNPFVWLYQVAVKQTHELLADDGVIARGFNIGQYQAILMNQIMGTEVLGLANNFNYSITKKRMIMMSKEKSPQNRRYKLLIMIPVVLAVLLFNMQIVEVQAQEKKIEKKENIGSDGEKVFVTVDQMPEYPGGAEALQKYIAESAKYPSDAIKNGVSGRVFVTFVVNKEGNVEQARVIRGVDPSLDAEALRVINTVPKWTPGYEKEKAVNVSYTVPINFGLQDDKKKIDAKAGLKVNLDSKGEQIFVTVDQMPVYPGGAEALQKYIAESVKYPKEAVEKGISGRVFVTFVVNKEGNVELTRVVRGVDPLLDAEALRVMNTIPKWTPGYEKGEAVSVSYTVPINFGLKDDKKKEETSKINNSLNGIEPEFPGGIIALQKHIARNVKYPVEAQEKGETGRVFVTFIINKLGAVDSVRTARSVSPSLDEEAIRVIKTLPNWIPGSKDGMAVNVTYTLPINFDLKDTQGLIAVDEPKKEAFIYKDEPVFVIVEEMPEYPGGALKLKEFLASEVSKLDANYLIGKRCFITFLVTKEGLVANAHVVRGTGNTEVDEKALEIVNRSPKWKPGKQRGQAVNVSYTVPINFGA